jgi:bifunctional ADP-heptose synthase (sugar kinase/adenylyltransferase)
MGKHGMTVADRNGAINYFPAVPSKSLDVCGAGDTVLAAIGWAIASGVPIREAVKFALRAASLQVSRIGVSSIERPCP